MDERKKIKLEFPIHSSPRILYNYLSTPGGLSEWFAKNVSVFEDSMTFFWEGEEPQKARVLNKKDNSFIRFKWDKDPEDHFFEFRIEEDELTKDVSLLITDFASAADVEETTLLWENQVQDLMHIIGA